MAGASQPGGIPETRKQRRRRLRRREYREQLAAQTRQQPTRPRAADNRGGTAPNQRKRSLEETLDGERHNKQQSTGGGDRASGRRPPAPSPRLQRYVVENPPASAYDWEALLKDVLPNAFSAAALCGGACPKMAGEYATIVTRIAVRSMKGPKTRDHSSVFSRPFWTRQPYSPEWLPSSTVKKHES